RAALPAGAHGQDLGEDRDGYLGRRYGADVQPERAADAGDLVVGIAVFREPLAPRRLRPTAAERADIGRVGAKRGAERRLVEARAVGEDDDAGGDADLVTRQGPP